MNWSRLLSGKRLRDLANGKATVKVAGDPRSEFERDYDRAVFSTPMRRLQDKAQVFPLESNDAIRTRLTHSQEVANVAKDLARYCLKPLVEDGRITSDELHDFTTIAATCGLLHDVGNPPFGHAGELAIQDWFSRPAQAALYKSLKAISEQSLADFVRFDGNAQTIRLITKLQVLADEFGLNLTCGTIAVATKYLATSSTVDSSKHQLSKLGVFATEASVIEQARKEVGLLGSMRHPLTFLVEAADDIVYSSVDLEDGVKKGALDWKQLVGGMKSELGEANVFFKNVLDGIKRQLGTVEPNENIDQDALAQAFRVQSIAHTVPEVRKIYAARLNSIEDGSYTEELTTDESCEASIYIHACKSVAKKLVYSSKDVLRLELMGRRIIQDLMDVFWEGAREGNSEIKLKQYSGKAYRLISSNYRFVFEKELSRCASGKDDYHRAQLVVDYIAGMTDTFALQLHRQLYNG